MPRRRRTVATLLVLLSTAAALAGTPSGAGHRPALRHLAALPAHNASGEAVPLREVDRGFRARLEAAGVPLVDRERQEAFLAERRVRYTGGLDALTARALAEEEHADAAVVLVVDGFHVGPPPRLSMTVRVVASGEVPRILWMDGVTLAGEENPGFFDLGVVSDPGVLIERGLDRMADAVAEYFFEGAPPRRAGRPARRFAPRKVYQRPGAPPRRERVAVLPLIDESGRRNAGEVMALHVTRALVASGANVVDPGEVRRVLLDARVIQDDGLSFAQADVLRDLLEVDLVVTGKLFDYRDSAGEDSYPYVNVLLMGIDAHRRQVAWSTTSWATGEQSVNFFAAGRRETVHELAFEVVRSALKAVFR